MRSLFSITRLGQGFLVFLLLLFFSLGCETMKPDVDREDPAQKGTLESIFSKKGLNVHLKERFSDSTEIAWTPGWPQSIIEHRNDSIVYTYIPLVPSLRKSKTNAEIPGVAFSGYAKYIIAKITNGGTPTFYFGKYVASKSQPGTVNLANFTGNLFLENLENGQFSAQRFVDGKKAENQGSNGNKIAGCVTIASCTWGNWNCGAANIAFTSGEISCDPPSWSPCFGATWEITFSDTEQHCSPDEPDPNNPGIPILTPTTTSQMINDHFKINTPNNIVAQINNYLNCFTAPNGGGIRQPYQIRLVVDQPINNNTSPVTANSVPVGHAYLEITQYGQRNTVLVRRSVGFWPNGLVTPANPTVPGVLNNDSGFGGSPDVAATFNVSYSELQTVTSYISSYADQPYNLMNRNCANMCSDALAQIGINIPNSWQQTFWYNGSTSGSPNPSNIYGPSVGAYGQVVRNLNYADDSRLISKETSGVTTRPNQGTCN